MLTDEQRADRAMLESDLQRYVTDLATLYGWLWVHFRHAKTERGWRVPVEGPMGKGWPDLYLVHPVKMRTMFIEIKRQLAQLGPEQDWVLQQLRQAGNEVHVIRPEDLRMSRIQDALA